MKIIRKIIKLRKELILILISLLLCFFLLEVFARIYYFKPIALIPSYGESIHNLGFSGLIEASNNCEITYQLKPNLDSIFKLSKFKTNSQGLRDIEYSITKPENTCRIVVLGDSLTMPSGVDIEDAYHSILEEQYNQESNSNKYEFINFGVGGYSLKKYLAILKYKALEYNPDHILVGVTLQNDLPLPNRNDEICNYTVKNKTNPYLISWSFVFFKNKIKNLKHKDTNKQKRSFDLQKLDQILNEFKDISTKNSINLTFVVLRRSFDENKYEYDTFNNAIKKHNLSLIDTSYVFKNNNKNLNLYRLDGHPNTYANLLFAQAIKQSMGELK